MSAPKRGLKLSKAKLVGFKQPRQDHLSELPNDLLFVIFSYLSSWDILLIIRTSRRLREFFHKNAAFICTSILRTQPHVAKYSTEPVPLFYVLQPNPPHIIKASAEKGRKIEIDILSRMEALQRWTNPAPKIAMKRSEEDCANILNRVKAALPPGSHTSKAIGLGMTTLGNREDGEPKYLASKDLLFTLSESEERKTFNEEPKTFRVFWRIDLKRGKR
ncbi:hypothetical protein VTL71DRAFT_10158 [Oculimacula yallundae]|uniref:F-box domain-containing protein n=1 Tax=Oculimacula yallundae TaxID=86028 RepID=A0ABR4BPR9_9HELO